MTFGTTALRGVVGGLFAGHGAQKLFGSFGGHGLEGTGQVFESLGLRPGKRHATAAGLSELAGGALIATGTLTPVGAALINGTMVTAIRKAHAKQGPWVTEGGWEYNAVLIAAATALADTGPGRPSVDARRFPRLHGTGWALASLLAGVAGSYLATSPALAEPPAPAPDAGEAPAGDPAARAVTTPDSARFSRDDATVPDTTLGGR